MKNPFLSVHVAKKTFDSKAILKGLQLDVQQGEIISIVGKSGCGKSTLLRIISGLDQDYQGEVTLHGLQLKDHSDTVGFIFQEPRLFPWLTVAENVGFGSGKKSSDDPLVLELLEEVGLKDAASLYPKQLSGGMAQRVAIARGLYRKPSVLLLDEPFSAVDAFTRIHLQDLLIKIAHHHQITLLLVTHDIREAAYLSDRVVVLSCHPGNAKGEVKIGLSHPRERLDITLHDRETAILTLLEHRVSKTLNEPLVAEFNI